MRQLILILCFFAALGSLQAQTQAKKIKGQYSSKQGVMVAMSCHCYNNGELLTDKGERILVCLPDGIEVPDCDKVELRGNYVTNTNNPSVNEPCSRTTMTYFYVKKVKCLSK